jgi:hypothetical protein
VTRIRQYHHVQQVRFVILDVDHARLWQLIVERRRARCGKIGPAFRQAHRVRLATPVPQTEIPKLLRCPARVSPHRLSYQHYVSCVPRVGCDETALAPFPSSHREYDN